LLEHVSEEKCSDESLACTRLEHRDGILLFGALEELDLIFPWTGDDHPRLTFLHHLTYRYEGRVSASRRLLGSLRNLSLILPEPCLEDGVVRTFFVTGFARLLRGIDLNPVFVIVVI
jgi:hypothetical protein